MIDRQQVLNALEQKNLDQALELLEYTAALGLSSLEEALVDQNRQRWKQLQAGLQSGTIKLLEAEQVREQILHDLHLVVSGIGLRLSFWQQQRVLIHQNKKGWLFGIWGILLFVLLLLGLIKAPRMHAQLILETPRVTLTTLSETLILAVPPILDQQGVQHWIDSVLQTDQHQLRLVVRPDTGAFQLVETGRTVQLPTGTTLIARPTHALTIEEFSVTEETLYLQLQGEWKELSYGPNATQRYSPFPSQLRKVWAIQPWAVLLLPGLGLLISLGLWQLDV